MSRGQALVMVTACCGLLVLEAGAAGPQPLTTDGRIKRDPVFVDRGRRIVYTVKADAPRLVLMTLDRRTGRSQRWAPDATLPELKAVFSATGNAVAWLRITGNDQVALLVRSGKKDVARVVKTSKSVAWSPAITPRGGHVVFNQAGQLLVHDISSGRKRPLAKSSGRNDWPAVSADGRRVAFGSSRDGNMEIYVVGWDGEVAQRLTNREGLDIRPAWSPDGKRIAFTSVRAGNYEVAVIHADGTRMINVSRHSERDDYPVWHPDGQRLVWVAERDGRYDLVELSLSSSGDR